MKLIARIVPIADLSRGEVRAMFDLMCAHYENIGRSAFEHDLYEKDVVIQVHDPASGALCGFSTQVVLASQVAGRPVQALFSGDTIVDRRYWGDRALSSAWGRFALSLIDDFPADAELVWFLISKGFRTYRFLPLFFHEFYPRYDRPTPAWARQIRDALAAARFHGRYDAARGVVHASDVDYYLANAADAAPARRADPHVRFFLKRNPGHAKGDELCCIAPLTRENFTDAAYRVIHSACGTAEVACD